MLLSIIIPIYNRAAMVNDLYHSLLKFDQKDIEIILINDGSTDDTQTLVEDIFDFEKAKFIIHTQDNKGPGGARNKGLEISTAKYVWFVDSDDEANIEAYDLLKKIGDKNYDFIDFNYKIIDQCGSMPTKNGVSIHSNFEAEGEYIMTEELSYSLKEKLGTIWTKIFLRDFWTKNNICYAENCFYEDNYLLFTIPFHVKKFYRSHAFGYHHIIGFQSITRPWEFNYRTLDRTIVAQVGLESALERVKNQQDVDIFVNLYIQLFPITTSELILIYAKSKFDRENTKEAKNLFSIYLNEKDKIKETLTSEGFTYNDSKEQELRGTKKRLIFKYAQLFRNKKLSIDYYYDINRRCWKKPIYFRD